MPKLILAGAVLTGLLGTQVGATAPRCLFINSYHQGYAWSDGVERGLRSVLEGHCEIRQFDMDTKRNKGAAHKKRMGLAAKDIVESWAPDVVITADDSAAKYVIQPYFKDADTPFVFGGVNWTAKTYGFPYKNVTGMVEVAPVKAMLKKAIEIVGGGQRFFYIGADTLTERKNLARFVAAAKSLGIVLEYSLVGSVDNWLLAYKIAQVNNDALIIGNHSGVTGWKKRTGEVQAVIAAASRRLSVTNHDWMMPFTMFGMTKIPEEHGEWAAKVAIAILGGTPPSEIPIVTNRKWDLWVNDALIAAAHVDLPANFRRKAKTYQ